MARSAIPRREGLALLLAGALTAPVAAEVNPITATIDPTRAEAAGEAVAAFVGALPDFPGVVPVDLTILPDAEGRLGVELVATAGGEAAPLDCPERGFGRIAGTFAELRLPALAVYPHVLMQVTLNGQTGQTGLVMSCDYRGGPDAVFRLKGWFLVSKTAIPTADDVLMVARPAP